jgi:hypothetical protein
MNDSTVQVIGYWNNMETHSYTVTNDDYKIKGSDTTEREFSKYLVDITIVDSTADSYTIDWFYHDYDIRSANELINKMSSVAEDMTVRIKTNELGVFLEVINWEEIKQFIHKGTSILKEEFKDIPDMDKLIDQMEGMYSSKSSIEGAAIREIQQFYTYHGGKYQLGKEIQAQMKVPNLYGGEPFDSEVLLWIDEINPDDNYSVIRIKQTINSEQLTKTTFDYLTKISSTLNSPAPKWEDFPPLKNETWTESKIHGSGWIIYSDETKEVSADDVVKVENRMIEIK